MDDSNTIKNFTAADIEKYHKGLLSGKQMHELEKAALDDPFLADALEGFTTPGVNAVADIAELKQRLAEKTEDAKVIPMKAAGGQRKFPWLRAAALVLVIASAGILGQKMFTNKKNTGIAKADEKEKVNTTDNTAALLTDTVSSPAANGLVSTENDTKTYYLETADSNTSNLIASNKPNQQVNTGEAGTVVPGSFADTEEKKSESDDIKSRQKDNNAVAGAEIKANPAAPVTVVKTAPGKVGADQKFYHIEADSINPGRSDIAKEDARKMRLPKKELPDSDKDGIPDQYKREQTTQNGAGALPANSNANSRAIRYNNQPANVFRGRVTDANNVGLPFARVMNPADNNAGTYTDVRGYFTITYPDSSVNVQVKSVGFDDHNIQLRSTLASNQVTMQEDRSIAAEVVSTKKPNAERRRDANMKLVEPEPIDGWDNYDTYIANNVEMPDEFKTKPAFSNGSVDISFEVNKYGEPINIKVEKSLCSKCDKEAIRLVKEGPKFRRNANKHGRTTVTISF